MGKYLPVNERRKLRKYNVKYTVKDVVWASEVEKEGGVAMFTGMPFSVSEGLTLLGPSVSDPREDRPPITVLAVVQWASWENLPPPIWVEVGKPQSVREVLDRKWEDPGPYSPGGREWRLVKHATNKARVLLNGEKEPRELIVDFVHEDGYPYGYKTGSNRPEVHEVVRA